MTNDLKKDVFVCIHVINVCQEQHSLGTIDDEVYKQHMMAAIKKYKAMIGQIPGFSLTSFIKVSGLRAFMNFLGNGM
jgi:hypothetical protein